MSKKDLDNDESDDDREPHPIRIRPASEEIPDDTVHVDLTEDPESQDWLAEGRREDQSKSIFDMSDEEREEYIREGEEKLERKEEQDNDG